jgi:hypothetical protein
MIIDDTHRAAFVHIPKCAGTSVRRQLEQVDSYGGYFWGRRDDGPLGFVDYGHLPLFAIAKGFPAELGKLRAYRSFAVTREPHARFASAVFERLQEFHGVPKLRVNAETALREARSVIAWLSDRGSFYDSDYIHFCRQCDYVVLDGERIIDSVFALESIEHLARALETSFKVSFDPERRERINFASGNPILALLLRTKPIYSRLTTWGFRERVLLLLRRWRVQRPDALYEMLSNEAEVSRFVESYYAEDIELHRAAMSDPPDVSGATGQAADAA